MVRFCISENPAHQGTDEENLRAQRHRETGHGQLNPLTEPICGHSVVHKGGEQRYDRHDLTNREALNGQDGENGRQASGTDDAKCQLLRRLRDHKENQTEYNDVFQPHLLQRQRQNLILQAAEFQSNRIDRHAIHHAEHHEQCENKTLKLRLRHKIVLSFFRETKK